MYFAFNNNNVHIIDVPVSNNSGNNSSDSSTVIGGAVGGVILLLLITIMAVCVIILCMRRSHKRDDKVSYNTTNKLNTDVTIDHNPSYEITKPNTADNRTVTNSDTKAHQSSCGATTKQYDYDYVRDDHLLHHNTATNITGDVKEGEYVHSPHLFLDASSAKQVDGVEYGVVNQPKSDNPDYDTNNITHDSLYY